jgi:hypothetical protein
MSTRAVIARVKGNNIEGRYHHWDGYPTGLGKTLFDKARELGVYHVLDILIDQHPGGWSTVNNRDWNKDPVYVGVTAKEDVNGPECYCHGSRSEDGGPPITFETLKEWGGIEWIYALDPEAKTLAVLVPDRQLVTVVSLDGEEPDWEDIQRRGYELD